METDVDAEAAAGAERENQLLAPACAVDGELDSGLANLPGVPEAEDLGTAGLAHDIVWSRGRRHGKPSDPIPSCSTGTCPLARVPTCPSFKFGERYDGPVGQFDFDVPGQIVLAHLQNHMEPPLPVETLDNIQAKVLGNPIGVSIAFLRALGHDGLKAVFEIDDIVDRARILAVTDDECAATWAKSQHIEKKVVNMGPITREFEVRRVGFWQIKSIDQREQTFDAHVYFECAIRGGWNDPHLMCGNDDNFFRFPYPGAHWYWFNQLDIANAVHVEWKERKILSRQQDSDDLIFVGRVDGKFQSEFKLQDFPLDHQDLSVVFEIKCAKEGITPVRIICPTNVLSGIDVRKFSMGNVWNLSEKVSLQEIDTGVLRAKGEPKKTYAALKCSVRVSRKAKLYGAHIVLPMASFSVLGIFLTFCMEEAKVADRLGVTLTLVLTATTYQVRA
jgi:hypothetical protein